MSWRQIVTGLKVKGWYFLCSLTAISFCYFYTECFGPSCEHTLWVLYDISSSDSGQYNGWNITRAVGCFWMNESPCSIWSDALYMSSLRFFSALPSTEGVLLLFQGCRDLFSTQTVFSVTTSSLYKKKRTEDVSMVPLWPTLPLLPVWSH